MELSSKYSGKLLTTDQVAEARNAISKEIEALGNIKYTTGGDYLLLKWGTWKEWASKNQDICSLMSDYNKLSISESAMMHKNSPGQKEILCKVIDMFDGVIQNDWDGEYYTKEKAKKYVMEYDE